MTVIESNFEALYSPESTPVKKRLTDIFPGIFNVILKEKMPINLFKTQKHYLNSLSMPIDVEYVLAGPIICNYIVFNKNDTKSVTSLPDKNIIYDPEPYWLRMLPKELLNCSRIDEKNFLDQELIFSRGSMSFAHFLSGELGSLIIADSMLPKNIPILFPYIKDWHYKILKFFGIKREVISLLNELQPSVVTRFGFKQPYLTCHLEEYQGLGIVRYIAQQIISKKFITSPRDIVSKTSSILWLSRYKYESDNFQSRRMLNYATAVKKLGQKFDIEFCYPEEMEISVIAEKAYQSSLIVCESGSLFMNYILFASKMTKVIQLAPNYCLGPTWSFFNINNMQWYWPVLENLYFFVGENDVQVNREFGSPWNVPSNYDIDKLSNLIDELICQQ